MRDVSVSFLERDWKEKCTVRYCVRSPLRVILSEVEVLVSERSETIQNHEQREVGSTNTAAVPFRYEVTFDKGQTLSDAIKDPA